MSTHREIVFSARDNGVENTISRIRNSAKEMGRDLVNEAMQNTNTAKDAIKYYEEQVKLIEKRNREEAKTSRISAESSRNRSLDSAGSNPEKIKAANAEFSKTMRESQSGSKEDQLQVDLLRELIDTVKSSSRDEVRSDKNIANTDRVSEDRQSGSDFGRLESRLKEESSGSQSQSKGSSGGAIGGGISGVGVAQGASGALGAQDMMGTIGSLASKAGPYGAAAMAGIALGKSVAQAGMSREIELEGLAATSGISIDNLMTLDVGGSDGKYGSAHMGVERSEFRKRVAPDAARAYGSVRGLLGPEGKAMRGLEVEKGMGVDAGVVNSLAKLTRVVVNSGDAQDQSNSLYRRMDAGGAFGKSGGDMSRMSEIMQSYVELQSANFMRSGSMSGSGMTMDLMGRFESMGGAYKNDQYKTSTIQSLDSGLSQGGTSETNAIKMGILRKLNPEKDFFDLQVEMEKGTNADGYLEGVMKYVRNTGGDDNAQKILLDQLTGGQMRGADVKRMVESREFDSAGLGNAYVAGGDKDFDFKTRSMGSTSQKNATSMVIEEALVNIKDKILLGMEDGVGKVVKKLDELIETS